MISHEKDIAGLSVTVMGLGLHGGGASTARFFASRGAKVLVTDLRKEEVLSDSIKGLGDYPITFILGEHREEDFRTADIVLKNPAVPPTSPYLAMARCVETDISIFLRLNRRPLIAVTGSKGKSTTTSAIFHALSRIYKDARLGGNITISPLSFLDNRSVDDWNENSDPVVLELSSWQLADLAGLTDEEGRGILRPAVSCITNILKDHQDRYGGMESYIKDKTNIFLTQEPQQLTLCNYDQKTGHDFAAATPAEPFFFSDSPFPGRESSPPADGAWLEEGRGFIRTGGETAEILPESLSLPGPHNRINLLIAAAALALFGEDRGKTASALAEFTGIAHRLELVRKFSGVRYYNDSAATIPDAVAAALDSFSGPIFLITGGTDKDLDFGPLEGSLSKADKVFLLNGTAEEKFKKALADEGLAPAGIYSSLKAAFDAAVTAAGRAAAGSAAENAPVVLLSPGCASFGMFLNEFDRGNQFRELVKAL